MISLRPARLALVWLLSLTAVACGPRAADVAGTWEGSWSSADGDSAGRFRVEIAQRGKVLRGPIELTLDWLPQARVEGVVEGDRVRWGVLRGGLVVLSFEGVVSGDAAQGRYSIAIGGGGTWTARRTRRRS